MSQSSVEHVRDRAVLFQQHRELEEFADTLRDLAVPTQEIAGSLPSHEALEGASVAIVCGNRLLEGATPNLGLWPRTIAVIDGSSKTLASHLNRIGVAMVIRRPIHPRALRLLLLHEIYRGPERRRRKRVLIGHPIRMGTGLFKQRATLLELSPGGARVEFANPPKIGSKVRLLIGKDLTKTRPIKLEAKVVRSVPSQPGKNREAGEVGLALLDAKKHAQAIRAILDRFALGPASLASQRPSPPVSQTTVAPPQTGVAASLAAGQAEPPTSPLPAAPPGPPTTRAEALPPDELEPAAHALPPSRTPVRVEASVAAPEPPRIDEVRSEELEREPELEFELEFDPDERRLDTRVPYEERIVALDEEAARVLVGREIAPGGMRIAANPEVAVGDVLRIALHDGAQKQPLIVLAEAIRDDGDDGIVLVFKGLSSTQTEQLEMIISGNSPIHATADSDSTGGDSIVLGEMLETVSRQGNLTEDHEIEAHLDSIFDAGQSV